MVDPNVGRSIGSELEVLEPGYTALRDSVAAHLGPSSVAANVMEQAAIETDKARQNIVFLAAFAGRHLPSTNMGNHFYVRGANAQLKARRIQAQTLWLPSEVSPEPYFIIGRKATGDPNTEGLLLLAAGRYHRVASLSVRRDDMQFRDELSEAVQTREFTEEEIAASDGSFTIGGGLLDKLTEGCVRVRQGIRRHGNSKLEDVREKGVRCRSPGATHHKMTKDELDQYETDTHLVKLAYAFGAEDGLRELVEGEKPKTKLTVEQLIEQNHQMRKALEDMMRASGIITSDEVAELVEARYPSANPAPDSKD